MQQCETPRLQNGILATSFEKREFALCMCVYIYEEFRCKSL